MRPKSITVTGANSPRYVPLDWVGGPIGITSIPNSANYDVAYSREIPAGGDYSLATDWTDLVGMSAATAEASVELGPATCLRITLNSGTSVSVGIVHNAPN